MAFSTGLLLKGLVGLGATVGVVAGSVFLFNKDKGETEKEVTITSLEDPAAPALPPPPKPSFKERLKKIVKEANLEESWFDGNGINGIEETALSFPFKTSGITEKLKTIKFTTDGSDEWNLETNANQNFDGQKIEIRDSSNEDNFPGGIMLIFENMGSEIKLKKKDASDTKTFKQKTFPEFKLENGKFKYAWTIKTLGEKVGLDCKEENGSKTCTLKPGAKINVKDDNTSSKKVEDVTFEGSLNFEEDQVGYSQGFKLTTTGDITLSKEGGSSLSIPSLSSSNSYDIKFDNSTGEGRNEGANKWYLRKYHTNNQ